MNAFIAVSIVVTFLFVLYHAPDLTFEDMTEDKKPEPVEENIDWWKR